MFHGRNKTNQENVLSWVRLKIPAIMSLHAFFCPLWKMHEPAAVAGNSSPVKKSIGQLASAALVRRGAVLHRSRLGLCQFGWVWSTVCVSLEVNAEVMVFDLGCLLSDWFGELLSRQKHSGLVFNQLMSWVILIWAMWSENATWLSIDLRWPKKWDVWLSNVGKREGCSLDVHSPVDRPSGSTLFKKILVTRQQFFMFYWELNVLYSLAHWWLSFLCHLMAKKKKKIK